MTRDEFETLMIERRERQIYPTDNDRKFFAKPTKSWIRPRQYHVRKSVVSDEYEFIVGHENPSKFITIVSREKLTHVTMPLDEGRFGGFVNSDEYAAFRLYSAECRFGRAAK